MIDKTNDAEYRRHVAVVCHALAMRRFRWEHPTASRAEAWKFATKNWQQFLDSAFDFLAIQAVRREDEAVARARLN